MHQRNQLLARRDAQLLVDVVPVVLGGTFGYVELRGDGLEGKALGEQDKHLPTLRAKASRGSGIPWSDMIEGTDAAGACGLWAKLVLINAATKMAAMSTRAMAHPMFWGITRANRLATMVTK